MSPIMLQSDIASLFTEATVQRFKQADVLQRQGVARRVPTLFVVYEGELDVRCAMDEDEPDVSLGTLGPGHVFALV